MKITDRMCNVVWGMTDDMRELYSDMPNILDPDFAELHQEMLDVHIGLDLYDGVFKEHTQPTTYSDYSTPGYCTLSISYDDFSGWSIRTEARSMIESSIAVVYKKDLEKDDSKDSIETRLDLDSFTLRVRVFAVRAVTMARNYRTHEVDHVVLTLEEQMADDPQGGNNDKIS